MAPARPHIELAVKRPIPGQVIEVVELQRHAKVKRPGDLGGKSFERWLGDWASRKASGEAIAVLVDYRNPTHCVVVTT